MTVPGGPTVACSTAAAIAWDKAWAGNLDPSGRAALGVHDSAYTEADAPAPTAASHDNDGHAEKGTSSSTYSPLSKPKFDTSVLKTPAMVHWYAQPSHVIAFSVASKKKFKGWSPSHKDHEEEEEKQAQCGFCVEAPRPTMDAQQAERPVREDGSFSPSLRLDL